MNSVPRRTMEELVARYRLEPSMRDLFVEGRFDARAFRRFARDQELDISIYEIDSVECTAAELAQLNLPDNTRSRVIWLAVKLSQFLGHESPAVRCIADTDFDSILGINWECGLLVFSDLPSLEVYFFAPEILERVLSDCVGIDVNIEELYASMKEVLKELFIARGANEKLHWGMSWMEPWKCIEIVRGSSKITFDYRTFESRYLNKNQRLNHIAMYQEGIRKITEQSNGVTCIRGHDAFELLAYWLKKQNVEPKYCDEDVLLAISIGNASPTSMLKFPMFQAISNWGSGQPKMQSEILSK